MLTWLRTYYTFSITTTRARRLRTSENQRDPTAFCEKRSWRDPCLCVSRPKTTDFLEDRPCHHSYGSVRVG
jgi:hypothetical protein